ncbi:10263_t:CDS:2 [Entrophospora sp. SA101]|nr:733_t:CDS:2 [Entrophospora sp. SA101]CAJ0634932.1 9250_t:CDS:2 [Entrophospora sp. SA101]CAJ0764930.1 10263_t:CDS:2 [Entrophospora sp. SA101]CAJ0825923.1 6244_t:CDS:2 [Entrophospora sp. SA101]CAJ0843004.1 8123_t:CDS:2 [Entrophospora sp. SA101]
MSSPSLYTPFLPFTAIFTAQTEEELTMDAVVKELDTEGLIQLLKRKNLGLKEEFYEILRKEYISGRIFSDITGDEFRSMGLPFGAAKILADFTETLKTQKLKAYSSYKTGKDLKDVLKEHGIVGTGIGDIPQFTPERYKIDENDEILELCMTLIKTKLPILETLLADDNERERCEYVESVLDSAIHIVRRITGKKVTRHPQMEVTGEDNTGRVDYAIRHLSELICITEGKFWNITEGFVQNLLQLQSSSQTNKRSIDTAFGEKNYIYGIVTTAEVWYFLKYTNTGIFCTSRNPLKVEFNESALEDLNEELSLRNHVKIVLEVIVGLLIDKLGTVEPPVKKVK